MRIARLPIVLFATCSAAPANADSTPPTPPAVTLPLHFTLTWKEVEESMDSNSTSEQFTVDGKKLSWVWDYGGYHPSRDFKRHRTASAKLANPEALRALIEKHRLARDAHESVPAPNKAPMYRTLTATLELRNGGKTTRAEFTGTTARFGEGSVVYSALAELRSALLELLPDDR
jgi:hypothetical protein